MPNMALSWMGHALALIGVREVPGPGNSPVIVGWLSKLGAWWRDDATPWCGAFAAHVMQQAGLPIPRHWYRAKAWLDWGMSCKPAYGALCILDRQGGGHIFFVTRLSADSVWGVGGNQGDRVCEARFARSRVLDFRWPAGRPAPMPLALTADTGESLSDKEA